MVHRPVMLSDVSVGCRRPMDDRPSDHCRAVSRPMPQAFIDHTVPSAIRKATSEPAAVLGDGWTVRIITSEGRRELRLAGQAQLARLALDLERLGFVLRVEDAGDVDFVFEQPDVATEAG